MKRLAVAVAVLVGIVSSALADSEIRVTVEEGPTFAVVGIVLDEESVVGIELEPGDQQTTRTAALTHLFPVRGLNQGTEYRLTVRLPGDGGSVTKGFRTRTAAQYLRMAFPSSEWATAEERAEMISLAPRKLRAEYLERIVARRREIAVIQEAARDLLFCEEMLRILPAE